MRLIIKIQKIDDFTDAHSVNQVTDCTTENECKAKTKTILRPIFTHHHNDKNRSDQ